MARDGVTSRDLRLLREIVAAPTTSDSADLLPDSALQALAAVIACDDITFQVMDPVRETTWCQTWSAADGDDQAGDQAGDGDELDRLFWAGFWECRACSYPQLTGDCETVTRLSDHYSRTRFSRLVMSDYFATAGVRHEVMVPLPPAGGLDRRLLLFRGDGTDFTDREVLLLALLRPHLHALDLRRRRSREGGSPLTRRQTEILRLVAVGMTNAQIARALVLSEATVGKHLEHIYDRLHVSSRTAAVSALDHTLAGPASA
jgi:DNA-binding CsgD family transcriptional regulator